MTNYRDSDFEFEFDIGSLYEYEGPVSFGIDTEVAPRVSFVLLDRFEPGDAKTPRLHANIMKRIAHLLVTSQKIGMDIRVVELWGYADSSGAEASSGDIGTRRAEDVHRNLKALMEGISAGSSAKVRFSPTPANAPPLPNAPSGGPLSRRVEVRLPATCQTFFAEYDLQSSQSNDVLGLEANPNLDKAARKRAVNRVGPVLVDRNADRAKKVLLGTIKGAQPVPAKETALLAAARELSTMQLTLFAKYHRGIANGFQASKLMQCFLKFANGQMRSPNSAFPGETSAAPDSFHLFLFAEFGFLCVESGIDPLPWTQALPALVAAQEVYMHVYRRSPVSPPKVGDALPSAPKDGNAIHPLEWFMASNFSQIGTNTTQGVGQSDAARLDAVTLKYTGMGIDQLRSNAAHNLLRAQMFRI